MADLEFEVAVRNTKPITFTLGDDHVYKFTPPKNAVMMIPLLQPSAGSDEDGVNLTRSTFDWLGQGLSEEDNDLIISRLKDPEDDLDIDLLGDVVQKLSEQVAGRPTT